MSNAIPADQPKTRPWSRRNFGLDADALAARERIGPLDLAREKERYGPDTKGGIGISIPA